MARYPKHLIEAIAERRECTDADAKRWLDEATFSEAMNEYLAWNGIIGYTGDIVEIARVYGAQNRAAGDP